MKLKTFPLIIDILINTKHKTKIVNGKRREIQPASDLIQRLQVLCLFSSDQTKHALRRFII